MNTKKIILGLGVIGLILSSFTYKFFGDIETIKLGDKAPMTETKMKATSGEEFSLNDLKQENGLLVIFSCNTCPFVIGGMGEGWEGRYNDINDLAENNKVGTVLVNSNEAKRDKGDSFRDMIDRAKEQQLKSTYVIDNESKLADAFGARTTPHVFLFDKDMKLVYIGAIDDNVKSSKDVKETYLKDALNQLGKGEAISNNKTRNIGCSIKRVKT